MQQAPTSGGYQQPFLETCVLCTWLWNLCYVWRTLQQSTQVQHGWAEHYGKHSCSTWLCLQRGTPILSICLGITDLHHAITTAAGPALYKWQTKVSQNTLIIYISKTLFSINPHFMCAMQLVENCSRLWLVENPFKCSLHRALKNWSR